MSGATVFAGVSARWPELNVRSGPAAAVAAFAPLVVRSATLVVGANAVGPRRGPVVCCGSEPVGDPAAWMGSQAPRGRYALCWWTPHGSKGGLVSDRVGSVPLFVFETDRLLYFATELRELLHILPRTPDPDPVAVDRWLRNQPEVPGRGLFGGVRRLAGGERISFGDGPPRGLPSWEPRAPKRGELLRGADAEVAMFDGVRRSVDQSMPRDGEGAVLLSGGLDSSLVAAHMAGIARARGEARPTAYAATFPDHPELDEAPYRDALSRHVGLDLVEVPVKAGPLLPAGQAYVERWATPAPNGSAFLFGPVTRAAVGRGHRFLLDGEGGDELFAPEPYLLADLLLRGNLIGLVQCALRLRDAPRLPRRRVMQQALRRWAVPGALPWWLHSRIRRARRHEIEDIAWKRRPGPRWWAHLVDDLTTGHPPENLDVLRRLAALDGAINLNPLLDDELVSCVLSIDPASVFDPEIDRGLVRRAHRGLLPELILQRGSKVEFGRVYLASIVEHDLKDATRDLRDPDAPIRQFANAATIDAILAPRSAKMDSDWARRLWRITALNTWLVTLWSS